MSIHDVIYLIHIAYNTIVAFGLIFFGAMLWAGIAMYKKEKNG